MKLRENLESVGVILVCGLGHIGYTDRVPFTQEYTFDLLKLRHHRLTLSQRNIVMLLPRVLQLFVAQLA